MGLVQELQKAVPNSTTKQPASSRIYTPQRGQKGENQVLLNRLLDAFGSSAFQLFSPSWCVMEYITRLIHALYPKNLEPREQYFLAATEPATWWICALSSEEERLVEERYWEMMDKGWFSD